MANTALRTVTTILETEQCITLIHVNQRTHLYAIMTTMLEFVEVSQLELQDFVETLIKLCIKF